MHSLFALAATAALAAAVVRADDNADLVDDGNFAIVPKPRNGFFNVRAKVAGASPAGGRRLTDPSSEDIPYDLPSRDWVRVITGTGTSGETFNGIFEPVEFFYNSNNGLIYLGGYVSGTIYDSGGATLALVEYEPISLRAFVTSASCDQVTIRLGPNVRTLNGYSITIAQTSLTIPGDAIPGSGLARDFTCAIASLLSQPTPPPPSLFALSDLLSGLLYFTQGFSIFGPT